MAPKKRSRRVALLGSSLLGWWFFGCCGRFIGYDNWLFLAWKKVGRLSPAVDSIVGYSCLRRFVCFQIGTIPSELLVVLYVCCLVPYAHPCHNWALVAWKGNQSPTKMVRLAFPYGYQSVKTTAEHQSSWDLWMFIPPTRIGVDASPYQQFWDQHATNDLMSFLHRPASRTPTAAKRKKDPALSQKGDAWA